MLCSLNVVGSLGSVYGYNILMYLPCFPALVCYTLKDLKDVKEVGMAIETAIASKQVHTTINLIVVVVVRN